MGDEESVKNEAARNFLEAVSYSTLESRQPIPSFDTGPNREDDEGKWIGLGWEPDTMLRLEVTLLGKGKAEGGRVVIFGPEREDGARPVVIYDAKSHEKLDATEPGGPGSFIREIATIKNDDPKSVLHEGDFITISEFTGRSFQNGTNYSVESIRSGKSENA